MSYTCILNCNDCCYCISPGPALPPVNVTAFVVNSTALEVTWEPVSAIAKNGIITQYEIEFNQTTFSAAVSFSTVTVNSSTLMVKLSGLEEYVQYFIRVRAYTIVGPGPYSDVINQIVLQDRKLRNCIFYTMYIAIVHNSCRSQ